MTPDDIERLAQRMVELWWAEHDKREEAKAKAKMRDWQDNIFGRGIYARPPVNAIGGPPTVPPRGVR